LIGKILNSFFDAVRLLTVLPMPKSPEPPRPSLLYWFPLIGATIGIFLAVTHEVFFNIFPKTGVLTPILVIVLWLSITRGLHIDGLGDTFDALGAVADRNRRLEILRDPHVGTIGTAAVACVLIGKTMALSAIPLSARVAALISSAVCARWMAVIACALFPYARQEGLGAAFIGRARWHHVFLASAAALLFILIPRGTALSMIQTSFVIGMGLALISNRAFGGITGDVLGAIIELVECAGLFVFSNLMSR